ncbi:HD domain-containing protein [Shewanella sp. 10N.286.51.B2]|uniref:HD domain-containing protein n=1 Tax=Shewanella sp. 10N.286.51.B2 TaxID=3229707 RepID=UPI00354CD7BF
MSNSTFVWIKDIKLSGHLPTANCEFISDHETIQAITSAEIARNCQISYGLAQINASQDSNGNIVICAIRPIKSQCSEQTYLQLVDMIDFPNKNLMGRFFKLISLVTFAELKPFTNYILSKPDVLKLYIQSQASFQHHHAYKNGLFEHSIEVAEMTYQNARHLKHPEIECQTGLIAGLFHDIGKIYPQLQNQSDDYIGGPHESYNFALLANPLGELGTLNSKVFSMLSDLLSAKPYGHKTRYAIEFVLKQADRTSAESNFVKRKFEKLPEHYYFTKVNGSVMYRLNSL